MGQTINRETLDTSLSALVAAHGYRQVLTHLVQVAQREKLPMPSARDLMTLSPEEREPFLEAAVEDALPLYEADLARPETERQLTADFAGDLYEEHGSDHA